MSLGGRAVRGVLSHRRFSSTKEIVDRRQHNRYRLAAYVTFSWETEDHHVHHGDGQTRDCSLSGTFIVSRVARGFLFNQARLETIVPDAVSEILLGKRRRRRIREHTLCTGN